MSPLHLKVLSLVFIVWAFAVLCKLLLSYSLLAFAACLQNCVRRRTAAADKLRRTYRYQMSRGRIP